MKRIALILMLVLLAFTFASAVAHETAPKGGQLAAAPLPTATLTPSPLPTSAPVQAQGRQSVSGGHSSGPDLSCHYDARAGERVRLACNVIVVHADGSVDANEGYIGTWSASCTHPVYVQCQ